MLPAHLDRERFVSRATFILPLLAYIALYFVDRSQFHPSGDGYYSWIFARSIAFDGDVDFRNDYALCGDPMGHAVDRGTGHVDNPFYAGPAVFWVPQLVLLRGVFTLVVGAAGAARASCGGWMTALAILAGPLCGALTIWFSYKAARLLVPASIAGFTALLFAFSSPIFPYSTSVAHYSHVYLAFTVAALTYLSLRMAISGVRARDALWLAVLIAIAVLHRLPALLYAVVPLAGFFAPNVGNRARLQLAIGIAVGSVIGTGLTGLLYVYLYGKWLALPQGPNYVYLSHAHPLLVLFGVHGGFFFWMPAAWLAALGFVFAIRDARVRLFSLTCLVAFVVETIVSSGSLDWSAHWTLGARRLLPLMVFVIVFAAVAMDRLSVAVSRYLSAERQRSLALLVIGMTLVNNIPAATTIRGDVEFSQRELYGAVSPLRPLWSVLDRAGIDLALLPAELYFTLRYGLPTTSYREAITPRYRRGHRDLLFFPSANIDLREVWAERLVSGASWSERGALVSKSEARVVFSAEWPFATHVRLLVSAPAGQEADFSMAIGGAFGRRRPVGTVHVRGAEPTWVALDLPAGSFDSGVNEWTFRSDGAPVLLSNIEIGDRQPLTPYGEVERRSKMIVGQLTLE